MFNYLKMATVAGALMLMSQGANAAVLTFDSAADCSSPGVTITAGAAAEACFTSTAPGGSTALLRSTIGNPADTFWTATFSSLVSGISIDLGDFNADADRLFISAFNLADELIETVTLDILDTEIELQTLSLTSIDVVKITFGVTGEIGLGGIFADNLTYTTLAAVPLPAGGLLLIGALGGLGFAGRRRKAKK